MSIAIKRLERAISDLPKCGMQTGSHKVKLDLCDAERLIVEINALQAERDALAANVNNLRSSAIEALNFMWNGSEAKGRLSGACESTTRQCLAAHDAEVAANAIDAAVDFEDGRYCETVGDRVDMILDYARQLRAKAQQ